MPSSLVRQASVMRSRYREHPLWRDDFPGAWKVLGYEGRLEGIEGGDNGAGPTRPKGAARPAK
jgi:hypothetical protein